jgi:ribosomal protein S6--L-glutamate ligase
MAPKIGFIVEGRYLRQEMPRAVIRELQARGLEPDVLCPQGARFDPQSGIFSPESSDPLDLNWYDVVVARCRDALGLAMLAYAETAHILTINTRWATEQVRSKAEMAVALERAGIPCAPTVLASDVAVLAGLSEDWFPLLLKPTYGDNSQGLRLIRRRDDLWDVHWPEQIVLAQRYLPNDGFDLKFSVCGDRVFATRRPSPFNGEPAAVAQPVKPEAALVDLALRCGRVFGLDIYGVDTVETAEGLVVLEVNEFPNFTAVAGAGGVIADYLLARAEAWEVMPVEVGARPGAHPATLPL